MVQSLENVLGDEQVSLKALQVLADSSFDSVLITDASKAGKIIYANKAFKALTGYDPASVVGKTPRILQGPATDKRVLKRLVQENTRQINALTVEVAKTSERMQALVERLDREGR